MPEFPSLRLLPARLSGLFRSRARAAETAARTQSGEDETAWRDLGDSLPGGFIYRYVEAAEGPIRLLHISAGMEEMCGWTVAEALAHPERLIQRMDPSMLAAYHAGKAGSAAAGSDFSMDLRFQRGDGVWRWARLRSRPAPGPDGWVWTGLAVDITDRMERVQELEETEARFRLITGAMTDYLGIIDAEGRFLYLNREPPGAAMEDLIGSHYALWVDPDYAAGARSAFEACLWTGKDTVCHVRRTRPDGSQRWFEAHLLPGASRNRTVVLLLQDRTAERVAEMALREREARFRSMVENAADAIFIQDQEGRFLFCNQEACNSTGYSREEFTGLLTQDLIPDFEAGVDSQVLPMLLPGQQMTSSNLRVRRKDGSTFPVEVRASLIGIGEPRRVLGIARNLERLGRHALPQLT